MAGRPVLTEKISDTCLALLLRCNLEIGTLATDLWDSRRRPAFPEYEVCISSLRKIHGELSEAIRSLPYLEGTLSVTCTRFNGRAGKRLARWKWAERIAQILEGCEEGLQYRATLKGDLRDSTEADENLSLDELTIALTQIDKDILELEALSDTLSAIAASVRAVEFPKMVLGSEA